jgi:hypothetical protein
MILTLNECKTILGITDNTNDEKLRQMIPYVQSDIIYYCNNPFADEAIYVEGGSAFDFIRGATSTATTRADRIHDADDNFSTAGFTDGMDVIVAGGANEGVYTISSVSSDTMKMTCTGEFVTQSQTTYYRWPGNIRISRAVWPRAVKMIAAKMVWHLVDKPKVADVKSESIDDYSVTYMGSNLYPQQLVDGLIPYRRCVLI